MFRRRFQKCYCMNNGNNNMNSNMIEDKCDNVCPSSYEEINTDEYEEQVKSSKFIIFLKLIFSIALIVGVGFGVYYVITNF